MRELRPYSVKDVRSLVSILSKLAKSNLQNILSAKSSGEDTVDVTADNTEQRTGQLMFSVLSECWTHCENEIFEWFASLNNMTAEQFDNEPPGVVLETIEAIVDRKESRDFFSHAYLLFLRIGSSKTST